MSPVSDPILRFLQYPDAALVDHALARVNLNRDELEITRLHGISGDTYEELAGRLFASEETLKRRYATAKFKITSVWRGVPWVQDLVESLRKMPP